MDEKRVLIELIFSSHETSFVLSEDGPGFSLGRFGWWDDE